MVVLNFLQNKTREVIKEFFENECEKQAISERINSGFYSSSDKEELIKLQQRSDALYNRFEEFRKREESVCK